MHYFDTSAVIPLVIPEPLSERVERYVQSLAVGNLATGLWTNVEIASAIARKRRTKDFDEAMASDAAKDFQSIFTNSFELLDTTREDYDLARRFLLGPMTGLRAGDALHLAIAANRGADRICTLDQTMLKAGRILGLPMETEIK